MSEIHYCCCPCHNTFHFWLIKFFEVIAISVVNVFVACLISAGNIEGQMTLAVCHFVL